MRSWSRRWLSVLVLRALSVLVLADLSGLTHTAFDLACVLSGGEHVDEGDCDDDEPGHECPPGCINCHCWHAGLTAPASPLLSEALAPPRVEPAAPLAPPPYDGAPPKAPAQSALYRPPRALGLG